MVLGSLFGKLPLRFGQYKPNQATFLLAASALQQRAVGERMRVDRNGSQLSFLVITLATHRDRPRDYEQLASILQQRLRLTDTAGMLSDGRVGVLLPDTPEPGAWKVASDICDQYDVGRHRPSCEVYVHPNQSHGLPRRIDGPVGEQDSFPVAAPAANEFDAFLAEVQPRWKRMLDVVGAALGLLISVPVVALAIAAIKLTSRGSAFFVQEREGLGGRPFQMYKLRTMAVGADMQKERLRHFNQQDGPAFKMADDPRTTRVGRWLRATSLDELPQFWNVLRGEMSLVGPRPLPTEESRSCTPWQRRRLVVKPGMTCIWQVRARNLVPFDEWVRMDLEYIRHRSLWGDVRLLLLTVPAVLAEKGPR